MTNTKKQVYNNNLNDHVVFCGLDYLTPEENKTLRADIKARSGVLLPGCNNRATLRTNKNGDAILTSYFTDVAIISRGVFYKTWRGYSVTTLKHVNKFLQLYGMQQLNKRDWINLPVNEAVYL